MASVNEIRGNAVKCKAVAAYKAVQPESDDVFDSNVVVVVGEKDGRAKTPSGMTERAVVLSVVVRRLKN